MENNVSGIRDAVYNDLIEEYWMNQDKCFLYRYFWAESVEELLKKLEKENPLKELPEMGISWPEIKPKNEPLIREQLGFVMENHKDWARSLLLREAPGKNGKRERRDFWEELWVNDAGYQAGLISDTEYYLWLVEYLEARDVYYKDIGGGNIKEAHAWLYELLRAGLWGTEDALTYEKLRKREFGEIINIRTKTQVEGDLRKLAELLRSERDESKAESVRGEQNPGKGKAAGRLHNLKQTRKTAEGQDTGEDEDIEYLPWLTYHLEKMALHIKIKTWLQDSGYPFKVRGQIEKNAKGPRKQDFSMQLFETYFDRNYHFIRKDKGGKAALKIWHREGEFCVVDRNLAETLLETARQCGNDAFYIPLAVHMFTGCVFFLAGKENYRELYERKLAEEPENIQNKELKETYEKAKECCCFDYLRLDDDYQGLYPGDIGGALQMQPFFHENARKDYDTVLGDFKRYCLPKENGPLQAMRAWNGEKPADIPVALRWAYDGWEISERPMSRESKSAFERTRRKADKDPYNYV